MPVKNKVGMISSPGTRPSEELLPLRICPDTYIVKADPIVMVPRPPLAQDPPAPLAAEACRMKYQTFPKIMILDPLPPTGRYPPI